MSYQGCNDYEDNQGDVPSGSHMDKPRLILMGLKRSGKSSILKVVFHKVPAHDTLCFQSTTTIKQEECTAGSYIEFALFDTPGQLDIFNSDQYDPALLFGRYGSVIFVIDAQDDYNEAVERLMSTVVKAKEKFEHIRFEVFIHKVDGLSEDQRMEVERNISRRTQDGLLEAGLDRVNISYYPTTIYEYSVFEAFSKVVQKLVPQLPTLESLLDIFISNSSIEKAYLFDVVSKIYLATDSNPSDAMSYELCCDMIDAAIDLSALYGSSAESEREENPFDNESQSIVHLSNGTVIYVRQVNKYLGLVCLMTSDSFQKQGIIDMNFNTIKQAIIDLFKAESRRPASGSCDSDRQYLSNETEPSQY